MVKNIFKRIENPTEQEINVLVTPLREFNHSKVGEGKRAEFVNYILDDSHKILGGIYGWISWGWLYIDVLWVSEENRKEKLGTKLLKYAEEFAIRKNIKYSRLNTASFQALDFYLKNGYEIFAQIPILAPNGTNQMDYFLKKELKSNF